MILNRLSKREKILSSVTAAIVAVAFSYAFMVEPLMDKWSRLNSEISEKTRKLNQFLSMLKEEERIKSEFKKYAEHTRPLGTDEETIASLLKVIERKASTTSTHITNIRPRPARNVDFYKEFVFEVISESSLDELLRFIYELQNSKELLKVKKLTLTLKSAQSKTLRGVMEITKISIKYK